MPRNSTEIDLKLARENRSYYDGDLWRSWIGPRIPSTEPRADELMSEVERVFQSVNFIKECCDRHVNALIGKFPTWHLKDRTGQRIPTKDDDGNPLDTPAAQAERELQRWLDAVLQRTDSGQTEQGDPFIEAVTNLLITGFGSLRLWKPERFADREDPIEQIYLHAPSTGSVTVERNEDGFIDSITYYLNGRTEQERFNEQGQLEISTLGSEAEALAIDTGGRWTIAFMRGDSLLTPQIKKLQDAVNHALTNLIRNQEQAGFLEKIFLNAQLPGQWVDDASAPGGQRFVPNEDGLRTGPGQTTFLYGIPTGEPDTASYTNPSVFVNQPVSPSTFLEVVKAFRALILEQFGQGHLLAEGDGGISGVSRIQLRQDFETMLLRQKRTVEAAIANIFNVVLRLLGYDDLEAVVSLRITTGKLTPEERAAVIAEFDKGLLSKSTAMALLGSVEDVDAELSLMAEEKAEQMAAAVIDPLNATLEPPTPENLNATRQEIDNPPGSQRTTDPTGTA